MVYHNDLFKDFIFTKSLQEWDSENVVFTVCPYNNSQPVKRYQWKILPQGMLNKATLCLYIVQQPLEIIHTLFSQQLTLVWMIFYLQIQYKKCLKRLRKICLVTDSELTLY